MPPPQITQQNLINLKGIDQPSLNLILILSGADQIENEQLATQKVCEFMLWLVRSWLNKTSEEKNKDVSRYLGEISILTEKGVTQRSILRNLTAFTRSLTVTLLMGGYLNNTSIKKIYDDEIILRAIRLLLEIPEEEA